MPYITLVTGLWEDESKSANEIKLDNLKKLLKTDSNLVLFGEERVKKMAKQRKFGKTLFIQKTTKQMKSMWFRQTLQKWSNKGYLNSVLDYARMYLLEEAAYKDRFESDEMIWIDLSMMADQQGNQIANSKTLKRIMKEFSHHFFFHTTQKNVKRHSFEGYEKTYFKILGMTSFVNTSFFGGKTSGIKSLSNMYDDLLKVMIIDGNYWSEDALFSLLCFRSDYLITYLSFDKTKKVEYISETPQKEIKDTKDVQKLFPNHSILISTEEKQQETISLQQIRFLKNKFIENDILVFDLNKYFIVGGNIIACIILILALIESFRFLHKMYIIKRIKKVKKNPAKV